MEGTFGGQFKNNTQIGQSEPKMTMGKKRDVCMAQAFGVLLFASGLVGGLLIGIYVYHGGTGVQVQCKMPSNGPTCPPNVNANQTPPPPPSPGFQGNTECPTCKRRDPREAWDEDDPQIFAPLSREELWEVHSFLLQNHYVTRRDPDEALTLSMNYVTGMALFPPNKEAVLAYKAGTGPYPGRYAIVNMVRGNASTPDYMEYKIGPLGENSLMTAEQLYKDGELTFNSRPYDFVETAIYDKIAKSEFNILELLTKESFDGAVLSDNNEDFTLIYFNGPPGSVNTERESRLIATLNPLAPNGYDFLVLDVLPLSATIYCPGVNISTWYIYDFYYLNQGPFATAQALLDAYTNGTIRKFALPAGYRSTVLERHMPVRDKGATHRRNANMPPPRTYEPEGPRYTIKGHNVDYLGWNFDVYSGQFRGPGLFSVTFKGQSIAYEISLKEIAVAYGGGGYALTNNIYTGSSYGIGEYNGIVKTVDCPEHTSLLETSHWDPYLSEPIAYKSICVYEADGETALWRHKGYDFEGGLRNNFLVVRASATKNNHDYIVEWHFYLDGKIYTIVSISGYIQGSFWDNENPFLGGDKSRDAFGFKVQDNTHGLMHDHTFGFKVDLDILGADNTMEVINWKAGEVLTALRSQGVNVDKVPPYFKHNITRYLDYEYVYRERSFRVNLDEPKFWVVVNQDKKNKWGVKRGYQIKPLSISSQTLTDAHHTTPALSFSKYHCMVTKRREAEQYLPSTSDVSRLDKPVGHIDKYLDDEFINQTDIVNWVTIGFLHLPTSEDVPVTNRVESGFMLKPFNFFDKTEVFDMPGYLDTRERWRLEMPPSFEPCLEDPADDTCAIC